LAETAQGAAAVDPGPKAASPRGERVDIAGASKFFGAKAALEGVHLHVEPGTFLVLLGPSGSGKTTLLRCLAGIERLSEGTVSIGGEVVAAPGLHLPPERRHLAMVFQDYALWPHMTALKNVMFPLRQLRVNGNEARRRAHEMLQRVGLERLSERYPNELSGGEQQRVALARAFVTRPAVLFADEPTGNLDATTGARIGQLLFEMNAQSHTTLVLVTHDRDLAARCERIVHMEAGGLR